MVSPDAPQTQPSPLASSMLSAAAAADESADSKPIATKGKEKAPKPSTTTTTKDEKASSVELKKRRKAEKQARREQGKQEKQASAGTGDNNRKDEEVHSSTLEPGSKFHTQAVKEEMGRPHIVNRSGSGIGADMPRSLPVRTAAGKRAESANVVVPTTTDSKEVALFGHLYGQPKRTSVAGAGRDIHPAVSALGLQMSNYVICGSNARCIATLFCFKRVRICHPLAGRTNMLNTHANLTESQVIESYTTPKGTALTRHLTSHLSSQIDYLKSCRPLSVSMGNAIRWLKLEISTIDVGAPDDESKPQLCAAIDNFIRERITVADQVISASAGAKIQHGDVILTYAKSSLVQKTLLDAHDRGLRFRVIVIDSKPLFEGKTLARTLALAGVETQYSLLNGLSHAIRDATKVFLGAHAMMSNGRLYSRVGTALVAMMARDADVPVIVCCESLKFTERVALDSIVNNEIAPPDELLSVASAAAAVAAPAPAPAPASTKNQQKQARGARGAAGAATAAEQRSSSPLLAWHDTPNLQLLNIMYDVTPPEYIKMIITEYGSLPPSSVPVVHRLSTNS
ncbi:MAG: hypothetical protein M1816_004846 [Peltula sp. TS41687]|nr:MAG: hypothetical protein M1816_004846 [Peltula sp. TS41687]